MYNIHRETYTHLVERFVIECKATPIYLLVLRAQEVGNEPFWNKKKKLKNVTFLFLKFFLESVD